MKLFLLILVIFTVTHGAPSYKTKRNILPGDPRYNSDYHHVHSSNSDVNQFSQYLPPSIQYEKNEETKQNLQLPSTSYGVPFKPEAHVVSQAQTTNSLYLAPVDNKVPSTSYGNPAVNHVQLAPQLQHVEHQFVHQAAVVQSQPSVLASAPIPHSTYGVPVQQQQQQVHSVQQEVQLNHPLTSGHIQSSHQVEHAEHQAQRVHQPITIYSDSVYPQQQYNQVQPAHQVSPVRVQINQQEEHHQQSQQVHQVQQPVPIYRAPVSEQYRQTVHQFTPVQVQSNEHQQHYEQLQQIPNQIQQVSSLVYETPIQNHNQQVEQVLSTPVNNEKLIFEAPIQSVEVSQSHLVENAPTASASVNVDNDAVSVTAIGAKESIFRGYKYTQPTSSNGGYVY